MRSNLPVTGREYELVDDKTLMSVTDIDSHILYANDAFVRASGFADSALIGEPHNIVRHPDMPPAAFADLWATLKVGQSWSALVKNRRSDGDHYWVRANVAPMHAKGRAIGYMSVRTRPSRDEIAAAEAVYRDLRENRAPGMRLYRGVLLRTGLLSALSLFKRLPARGRVALGVLTGALLPMVTVVATGTAMTTTALTAGSAALGAGAAWYLVDTLLTRPLKAVARHAQRVANGDTLERLAFDRIDEIGMIARNVDQTGLKLRTFVDDVANRMAGVDTGTAEIAAANRDHSARTEQAAASLQQTAASMDQINATVRNNADTSQRSSALVQDAARAAREGAAAMDDVVQGMTEIDRSSRRIAEITGVIDSIAFQSNILALNAAVEAARAGEHGRGFGVVANEVRSLASRSATAAREIRTLIGEASERVQSGSAQVSRAGVSMQQIVARIDEVTGMIESIAVATTEQTNGIAQINQAVADLDRVTQENAAMVEQAAAASTAVSEQAALLNQSIKVFQVA